MSQTPYSYSFKINASHPQIRTLLDMSQKRADEIGEATWEMAPQPHGMWVRGHGAPGGLLGVLQQYCQRYAQSPIVFRCREQGQPETIHVITDKDISFLREPEADNVEVSQTIRQENASGPSF